MFVGVQYLRALAALLVVAFHLGPQMARAGIDAGALAFGANGVDVFFVISGFVMWRTTCDAPISPARFYERRLLRIAPLYWLITSVALGVALIAPNLMQDSRFSAPHVLASYLFWPYPHPVHLDRMEPLVFAGWTLNYEMFFYALFGLALLLPVRARLAALIATLVGLVALHGLADAPMTAFAFYTRPLLLEFGAGVLIGAAATRARRPGFAASLGMIGAGAVGLVAQPWLPGPDALWSGGAATLLVAGAVFAETWRPAPTWAAPLLIGDASYSIYLVHGFLLSALGQAWRKLPFADSPAGVALFAAAGVGLSIAAGVALHRLIEAPMNRALRRLTGLGRSRVEAAPATA